MRRHSWAPKTSSLTRSPRRSLASPTRGKGSARGCGRSRTTLLSRLQATSPPPSCTEPCLPGQWVYPGANPTESSQKKSRVEEPDPEPEATEGDGDKKGNAEGSSDEEGKLVIDEPTKEKNEKGALKRRAGDLLEDSPKRLKETEDPEGEEKEAATLEGERPLPVEVEKNSTPSEPSSGRGPPPGEEAEEEEATKKDAEAQGIRDHESL
ncbi:PREDICTED: hepatoma-derived growth factor isoform X1 [Dipodomys ordii]|uniref:Hepatoma-derived growth factor isoform X1 n=1 Tax=Dipodomys ordii TaxID=10020 RepID=A0A1S3GD00_DIPOR|nr:PREDICTED: hepatoma-derived growth factor isoform X1 [Dipodomys ordii]XP_042537833.1 hepatoma-derived growth factor isoform X2 [Dipodomys spectabilis]